MNKKNLILLCLLQTFSAWGAEGILFLAHGSMKGHHMEGGGPCNNENPSQWEKEVLVAVEKVAGKLPHQSEVAFGMWNSGCIDAAIKRLERKIHMEERGGEALDHLIVLPLFISSYSAVIEMQKYIFKKRSDRVIPLPMVTKTIFNGKITYLKAIDYNPHVAMILANRLHGLIHMAKREGFKREQMEVILVMHGPVGDKDNREWMKMAKSYLSDLEYLFPVSGFHGISLRDDASPEVKGQATKALRGLVAGATEKGKKSLILPLLLSSGGIEKGILKRLEGLEYIWSGEMLLPDAFLGKVLLSRFGPK